MHHTLFAARPAARARAGSLALAVTLSLLLLALGAAPADAKSSFMSRASGATADTFWTQVDGTPTGASPFGNVHVGWLYAYETTKGSADVFGGIDDFDCEEGDLPFGGGPHDPIDDEPYPPNSCEYIGSRFIDSSGIEFSIDKKLSQARLTGTLTVYGGGHGDGGVVGRPYADIVWTGTGGVLTEKHSYRYKDDGVTYSGTWSSIGRSATMSGVLGPMGFDPDLSGGWMGTFKSSDRQRTK